MTAVLYYFVKTKSYHENMAPNVHRSFKTDILSKLYFVTKSCKPTANVWRPMWGKSNTNIPVYTSLLKKCALTSPLVYFNF